MSFAIKIDKDQKVKLDDFDPDDTGKATKDAGMQQAMELGNELCDLQEWLYAAQTHSVLIVLQGMDTSGKDGTISHVMSHVNPEGCEVSSFKVPTPTEAAHDFLWRVHQQAPPKGMIKIFNRSHYEDVLVTRVHKLISKDVWEMRYQQINHFESLLASDNTIILKFYLHISKKEQEERLLDREKDAEKAWKLSVEDWKEREYWKDYTEAYEEALRKTTAKDAPWYIVPANHKWFRNLAIAETITATLRPYKNGWAKTLDAMGAERKKELAAMRAANSRRKDSSGG